MSHEFFYPKTFKKLYFTNLKDSSKNDSGSLRDLLENNKEQNVIICPDEKLKGIITLDSRIVIENRRSIIFDCEKRVSITGWALEFRNCHHFAIQNVAIRTTEVEIKKFYDGKRPSSSIGLDCLNFEKCTKVTVSNCSLWSSCDECISVVNCNNVHVVNTFIAFPLGGDKLLHPYGDLHAECANCSSATNLCFFECVFAYYKMRGPQFECNDSESSRNVKMQCVNCVMYGFYESGSRYTTAASDGKDAKSYKFQFVNNLYVTPVKKFRDYCIVMNSESGIHEKLKVYQNGNIHINEKEIQKVEITDSKGNIIDHKHIKNKKLFKLKCGLGVEIKDPYEFLKQTLQNAGVDDELDRNAKRKMLKMDNWNIFKSYKEVMRFID